jgi:tRNA G10  N-methylase Trm11
MDVFPTRDDIIKIDKWGKLPLDDNSIHSLVIDLPFVISPANAPSAKSNKEGASLIYKRFSAYYPVDNLFLSYYHWISEAYRVLDDEGLLIFKCQSMISGGIRHNVEEFSFMAAQKLGFRMEDKFTLRAKARLISPTKYKDGKQKHSRSYTSMFLVFIKSSRKKSKDFNYFDMLERCEREEKEQYINVVEK